MISNLLFFTILLIYQISITYYYLGNHIGEVTIRSCYLHIHPTAEYLLTVKGLALYALAIFHAVRPIILGKSLFLQLETCGAIIE